MRIAWLCVIWMMLPSSASGQLADGGVAVDLRLSHAITLRARSKPNDPWTLTVGVDAFNVLNHTNFTSYIGTVTSPLFGQATSAQPPRRVQFSLRTKF